MQLGYLAACLIIVEASAVEEIGRITNNFVGIYDNKWIASLKKKLQLAKSVFPSKSCFAIQSTYAERI